MVDLVINNISKQKTYMITVIVIFVSLVLYYSSIDVYNLKTSFNAFGLGTWPSSS